ncbi:pleckstrin homology domain-containing family G member 3-like isoform X2 [Stigmatopora nigra]
MAPTYLERVVSEIIETERTYVTDLRMIVEDYLAHVIERAELSVRPEQVCFLFGNIEDIYEFNSELLQDLDLCRRDAVAVARCFVSKSQYFDIYTQYCTNYPNSVAALSACMRDQSLAGFFRERQAASERPLPLGSYLLKPVQRILKYHLLLQEIAKHFDPEDEGYEVVEEAICAMTAVAWYINDMKRKHEHAVRLQEVQSLLLNWKGPELSCYGELVLEGSFKVHRAKNQRTLFLLERVLLITKRRGQHYVYKTHIACSSLMLIESAKDTMSFSVTHYKQPKRPHTVQAKSADEKSTWAQHIKRVILENHHDIIPQKAKDAIFNSQHPAKYRREKVPSSSSDTFPRRRSSGKRRGGPRNDPVTWRRFLTSDRERAAGGKSVDLSSANGGALSPLFLPSAAGRSGERSEEETEERGDLSSDDSNGESGLAQKVGAPPPPYRQTTAEEGRPPSRGSPPAPGREDLQSAPAESSSDEDVEKEAGGSILPPSVLDKAGAIARHLAAESPRRRGPVPARSPGGFRRGGGAARPRPDRGLSGRERLLVGKIRNYYDNAESGDAGFGLRRRESLTYIPAGLVKTSVGRLNRPGGRGPPNGRVWALRRDLPDGGKVARAEPPDSAAVEGRESATSGQRFRPGEGGHRGRPGDEGALRAGPPDGGIPGPPDDADGKVRHLARRYSRRLKSQEAPAGRSVGQSFSGRKALAGVLEESGRERGAPAGLGPSAPSTSSTPSGVPHSDEGFDWPDVRELRSKYSEAGVPESRRRRSLRHARPKSRQRLGRARSLDVQRQNRDAEDVVPREEPALPNTAAVANDDDGGGGEAYVEIRSPTSREKISIPAVADRCRAYQESDEYRARSRGEAAETPPPRGHPAEGSPDARRADNGLVKNLREKFQKLNS